MRRGELLGKLAVAFGARVIGALTGLLMTVVVTRELPQSIAGQLFLLLAVVNLSGALACYGTNTGALRFVGRFTQSKQPQKSDDLLVFITRLCMASGGALGLLILTADYFGVLPFSLGVEGFQSAVAVFVAVPALAVALVLSQALLGVGRLMGSVLTSSFAFPAFLILWVWQGTLGISVTSAIAAGAFAAVAVGVVSWGRFPIVRNASAAQEIRELLRTCPSLWILVALNAAQQWGGQLLVGSLLSTEDVAVFSAALRVTMVVNFLLVAMNMVVAPRFSALHSRGDINGLKHLARTVTFLLLLATLPLVVLLETFSHEVMGMFGAKFGSEGAILRVLLMGQLVNAVTGPVGFLLTMSGHERDAMRAAFVGVVAGFTLAVMLSFQLGLTGVCAGLSLGIAIQNVLTAWAVRRRLGFWSMFGIPGFLSRA
ncbi:lipopolysaccharide biosynthesis protein [Nitrogeniibacter aestuarii]|uniref:lipopolysaccharide biosynthesis protein n=1 Tax=Nitrogeniibacter aestuarii TaxID=2815343 RepID=UPI001E2C68AA|nr:lipopolysaccharide biosynthesis protein [Nitrogeniibacter aestuarii]